MLLNAKIIQLSIVVKLREELTVVQNDKKILTHNFQAWGFQAEG